MVLEFGNVKAILGRMHPTVPPNVVQARLKYLHRIDFPFPAENVGTGARVHYDVDALLRIVAVFELLAAGLSPVQGAALVREGWGGMSLALARGWMKRDEKGGAKVMAMVAPDGLAAVGGEVLVGDETAIGAWMARTGGTDRRVTLVETRRVGRALEAALAEALQLIPARRVVVAIDRAARAATRQSGSGTGG